LREGLIDYWFDRAGAETSSVLLRGRLDHEDEVTDALTSALLDASVIDVCVLREDDQLCSFN